MRPARWAKPDVGFICMRSFQGHSMKSRPRQLPPPSPSESVSARLSDPTLLRVSTSLVSSQSFRSLPPLAFMSDPAPPDQAASNSLGLDLDALKINDGQDSAPSAPEDVPPASADASQEADENKDEGEVKDDSAGKKDSKEKKKPYVNPDRVKTGGAQRVCPEQRVFICPLNVAACRRNPVRKSWQNAWLASGSKTKRLNRDGWYAWTVYSERLCWVY